MRRSLNCPLWSSRLFSAMTVKPVIRKFLEKTWGSKAIDQPLLNYAYQSAHQPGAEHAPYYFVSGHLFSKDILRVYQALELPVWMVRGTRGDFVDYHHATRLKDRENWTFDIFNSGAFPQYEKLPELVGSYERFLEIALQIPKPGDGESESPLADCELVERYTSAKTSDRPHTMQPARVRRRYAGVGQGATQAQRSFWQGRFGAVGMDEGHLAQPLRYVSLNPLRARSVERAQDWRWSSTRAHLRGILHAGRCVCKSHRREQRVITTTPPTGRLRPLATTRMVTLFKFGSRPTG